MTDNGATHGIGQGMGRPTPTGGAGTNQYGTKPGGRRRDGQTRASTAGTAAAVHGDEPGGTVPPPSNRKLKVFGCTVMAKRDTDTGVAHHRQIRMIVAATSRKAAAEAMDVPVSQLQNFGGVTGNKGEIDTAMTEPGRAFWTDASNHSSTRPYQRWDGQEDAARERAERAVRKAEFDARIEASRAERAAQRERAGESNKAAALWAERLRDEFKIDCEPANNGQVAVVADAEKLYGRLTNLAAVLRDVGMEELLYQADD